MPSNPEASWCNLHLYPMALKQLQTGRILCILEWWGTETQLHQQALH